MTSPTTSAAPAIPPIVKNVHVPLDPPRAFTAFTADFGRWWPLATHSVGGATSTVGFVDDQIVEVTADLRGYHDGWDVVLSSYVAQTEAS
jgi:hypothetical protein